MVNVSFIHFICVRSFFSSPVVGRVSSPASAASAASAAAMVLPVYISMKVRVTHEVVRAKKLDPEVLGLPSWCRYLPLKNSRRVANDSFRAVTEFDENDVFEDGKIHCYCLMMTLGDEFVAENFITGKLTKDAKHDGYRLVGSLPVDGSISYEWIEVKLG